MCSFNGNESLNGKNRYRVSHRGDTPIYFDDFDDAMDYYDMCMEKGIDVMVYDVVDDITLYKGEWT